jgi:hypothetical protein
MKCLNRIEMQEYIDKESGPAADSEIKRHLKDCELCSALYKEASGDKALINKLLSTSVPYNESENIPEFIYPVSDNNKSVFIGISAVLVAASLIGMIFLLRLDNKPLTEKIPEAEMILHDFYEGKDLNKMWHDKSQILILEDGQGNIIQTTITY